MSMVHHHWGSRSFEIVCDRAPVSWPGGGTLGYWHHGRKQEVAAGAAVLLLRQ